MIQGILSYQFTLELGDSEILEPDFRPIRLVFSNKNFSQTNYLELIDRLDIFGIFYQHTTGISTDVGAFSNFYVGRLKQTPYQVISHYRQDTEENQFITISIFNLDDDIEIFEDLVKMMGVKLELLFDELMRTKTLSVIDKIEKELRFAIFQISRLSELDKLQKVALIFQSDERRKILELLREKPVSKKELKEELEKIKPNPNIDLLIQPFLELNLIRRDWIKGEIRTKLKEEAIKRLKGAASKIKGDTPRRRVDLKFQGEYLFLVKDIVLARLPKKDLIDRIKGKEGKLYKEYKKKLTEFFSTYDINNQPVEELKELTGALLNPDVFDFYKLMTNNYYPLDKLPKIFSDFVDTEFVVNTLERLNVVAKVEGKDKKPWVMLLTEIKPLISFPEYLLLKIKDSYLSKNQENKISYEIARKALDLLEVSYPEEVEF